MHGLLRCPRCAATYFIAAGVPRMLPAAVAGAFLTLRHLPAARVVQGDILDPPVRRGSLDSVFSIGVLMHTGDARRATASLAGLLRPGGTITVHVYAAGFPVWQLDD